MSEEVKKPMSIKKKWGLLVAMALVFGLIAGGTMYGVNLLGNKIYSPESTDGSNANIP